MGAATVAEKAALAATVLAALLGLALSLGGLGACDGGSSSGSRRFKAALMPPLTAYVGEPDLEAQLEVVDGETGALGLTLEREVRGKLPRGGGAVVVRGYAGRDALGRPTHAVRVATSRGVVMAVGPLEAVEPRDRATELVAALVPGGVGDADAGAFQSGTDLQGDGSPDVVLRNEGGVLEVWGISTIGSSPYGIEMEVAATRALDADEDGRVDFAGEARVFAGEAIGARLEDVAVFEGGRYSNNAAGARGWHGKRVEALRALGKAGAAAGAGAGAGAAPSPPVSDEVRLRRAIELAWHRILAGGSREEALKELDREKVPALLRSAFNNSRDRVERIGRRSRPR
jgi:hypothetical protein